MSEFEQASMFPRIPFPVCFWSGWARGNILCEKFEGESEAAASLQLINVSSLWSHFPHKATAGL